MAHTWSVATSPAVGVGDRREWCNTLSQQAATAPASLHVVRVRDILQPNPAGSKYLNVTDARAVAHYSERPFPHPANENQYGKRFFAAVGDSSGLVHAVVSINVSLEAI